MELVKLQANELAVLQVVKLAMEQPASMVQAALPPLEPLAAKSDPCPPLSEAP